MKLLLINPNISDSVSALIRSEAERSASRDTHIEVLTAKFGVAYIETRFEAMIGSYAAAQLAAEHHAQYDAVVVAAFGDPGLMALREVLPIPVVGLTDAALASACLLGQRISIIAISQRIQAWYREVVASYGLGSRLASIRALDRPLASIGAVQDEHAQALQALAERAVDEDGADVIVCVGYLYGASLAWAADQYPDVKFIAVDVTQGDIGTDTIPANCYCITFKEEQAGYLAGYAIAKDGKTKLGFLGGMAVPAVIRYGYGYVQGADAAAKELGTNIDINYFYGGQFYGDANITSRMEGWYANGTQIVFACGGGIYTSAVEAALKNNGYVVGVDVDQNYIGVNGVAKDGYAYNPFITSAMKGLSESVSTALGDIEAGEWSNIAATNGNFGLEDGDYVGLPTADDSWNFKTFTKDEYETLKSKIASGELVVDNSSDDATKPTVSEFTKVNYIQ